MDFSKCCSSFFTVLVQLTEGESHDLVMNCNKNACEAWRRLQRRFDPVTGGRKRNLLRMIINPGRSSITDLQSSIERWEGFISRYERKVRQPLSDELKLAGLEALVPEDIERHLMLNSNRLTTYLEARLEVVTYVEARTGLKIKDSRPGVSSSRDPNSMDVDSYTKGAPKGGIKCWTCGGNHRQSECPKSGKGPSSSGHPKGGGSFTGGKKGDKGGKNGGAKGGGKKGFDGKKGGKKGAGGKKGKKGANSYEKEGEAEGESQWTEGGEQWTEDSTWTWGPESEWKEGEEWKEGAGEEGFSSLSLGSLEHGKPNSELGEEKFEDGQESWTLAMSRSSRRRRRKQDNSEISAFDQETVPWVKMNLDTGAALTAFPLKYGGDGAVGDGTMYRTASGECIQDGGGHILKGRDERGGPVHLSGRLSDVHKVLASAGAMARKAKHIYVLGDDGGWIVPNGTYFFQALKQTLTRLQHEIGVNELIPVYLENDIYNFYVQAQPLSAVSQSINGGGRVENSP